MAGEIGHGWFSGRNWTSPSHALAQQKGAATTSKSFETGPLATLQSSTVVRDTRLAPSAPMLILARFHASARALAALGVITDDVMKEIDDATSI
jgi:hypothetical protein